MRLAWFIFMLAAWPSAAQQPPDHDLYDILRQHASPESRRLWDMMENDDQESYDRAIKNRTEDLEDRIEELERERD